MGAYYYALGQRVELENDADYVAVDKTAASRAGLDDVLTSQSEPAHGGAGLVVARRDAFAKTVLDRLRQAGALQPVYKRERSMVVAMPEVRIEVDSPRQHAQVMKILNESKGTHVIAEDSGDRIVVRPTSGKGDDALRIANQVYERARPAASSVRLVQFVPKPIV